MGLYFALYPACWIYKNVGNVFSDKIVSLIKKILVLFQNVFLIIIFALQFLMG